MRRNYDALVAAGLDSETMPFGLFFMRYQFQGAFSWMLIVAVLDTLFADGKDDEYAYASLSALRDTKLHRSVSRLPVFCFLLGRFTCKTVLWRVRQVLGSSDLHAARGILQRPWKSRRHQQKVQGVERAASKRKQALRTLYSVGCSVPSSHLASFSPGWVGGEAGGTVDHDVARRACDGIIAKTIDQLSSRSRQCHYHMPW